MTVIQEGAYVVGIRLEGSGSSSQIMAALADFPKLRRLELASTRVSPAELARLESLVELELDSAAYKSADLANLLAEMPAVRRVSLRGVTPSDEELGRLQSARPEARFAMLPVVLPPPDAVPFNISILGGGVGGGIER